MTNSTFIREYVHGTGAPPGLGIAGFGIGLAIDKEKIHPREGRYIQQ